MQSAVAKVQKLKAHQKPAIPFFLLFDEFGAYATTPSALLWEQARSAGVCACAAFQTFSSLEALGKDFRNKIMGNSMVKIFYALNILKKIGVIPLAAGMFAWQRFTRFSSTLHCKIQLTVQ